MFLLLENSMNTEDIATPEDTSAQPHYLVETHDSGGILIKKYPDTEAGGVNLFSLDQVMAILEERLPQGFAVVLGGAP